jgi:hypothetical protein
LFLVGVVVQVFLAGMVVVALRMGWNNHRGLGHGLTFPLLVMLITIFLQFQVPVISALHPVLALARAAWPLARRVQAQASMQSDLVTSTIN